MSKPILFTLGVVEGAMVGGREKRMDVPNPYHKTSQVDKLARTSMRVRFYGILARDLHIHRRRCQSLGVL